MKLLLDYLNGLADHLASNQLKATEFMAHVQGAVALSQFKSEISANDAQSIRRQGIEISRKEYKYFSSPEELEEIAIAKEAGDYECGYDLGGAV